MMTALVNDVVLVTAAAAVLLLRKEATNDASLIFATLRSFIPGHMTGNKSTTDFDDVRRLI